MTTLVALLFRHSLQINDFKQSINSGLLFFYFKASIEHRKLAVDLAEVIIKWELQRIKDEQEQSSSSTEVDCVLRLNLKGS